MLHHLIIHSHRFTVIELIFIFFEGLYCLLEFSLFYLKQCHAHCGIELLLFTLISTFVWISIIVLIFSFVCSLILQVFLLTSQAF